MSSAFKGVAFDPDKGSRARLKTATLAVPDFETVIPCGTRTEALTWVERHDRIDLVFISEKVPGDGIKEFIDEIKRYANCDSAVFAVIKASAGGGLPVSEALLLGADGVLCEPFSVDNLMDVVNLARRLGQEREKVKSRITVTLLVTDILNQLDTAAYILHQGSRPKSILKSLRSLSAKVAQLSPDNLQLFFDIVARLSAQMQPMEEAPLHCPV